MDGKKANALKKALRVKEKQHNVEPATIVVSDQGDLEIHLNKTVVLANNKMTPRIQRDVIVGTLLEETGLENDDVHVTLSEIRDSVKLQGAKDDLYTQGAEVVITLQHDTELGDLNEFSEKLWSGLNKAMHVQHGRERTYAPKPSKNFWSGEKNCYGTLGADKHLGHTTKGNKFDTVIAAITDGMLLVLTLGLAWLLSGGPPASKNLRNQVLNTIEDPVVDSITLSEAKSQEKQQSVEKTPEKKHVRFAENPVTEVREFDKTEAVLLSGHKAQQDKQRESAAVEVTEAQKLPSEKKTATRQK